MPSSQYGTYKTLSLTARLKIVAKLHLQGFSAYAIARELEYDVQTAKKDVVSVINTVQEFDNFEEYLKDTIARTGDLLTSLKQQEQILKNTLNWANEWVVQTDKFGNALYKRDASGDVGELLYGPRDPRLVIDLTSQITSINEKQAKLLGLLNQNVDITVKLDEAEKIQVLMLEAIREASPEVQSNLVRKIKVLKAQDSQMKMLSSSIEGEYIPRGT